MINKTAGLLLSLALLAGIAEATEERFQVIRTTTPSPEGGFTERFLVLADTNCFSFTPGPGASVKALAQKGNIEISFNDGRIPIAMQVVSRDMSLPLDAARIQQQLRSRYPDAQITPILDSNSGLGDGFGFRLDYTTQAKARVILLTFTVPFPGGIITISQTALDEKHLAKHYVFGQLLNSLTTEKLKVAAPTAAAK
ncbi:hypothetical protein [Pedosphaera parvula]|uniref:DUF1795 domain-containing protein n=1 Tax=Pedosphaera parvula (strain Ellin514) TaxID=320771 RepID=B9XRJ7_PEDPL|nr:hypothetical protein [Pedosphaera parvula]EEF57516.1 hypothetical protein Cflav_PD0525 [Pedosphaera parvula Ellin514]